MVSKYKPGGLTFDPAVVSEQRLTNPSHIGIPSPFSGIIMGEDGRRYYIAGGTAGSGGGGGTVYVYDAETGTEAFTLTRADALANADAVGVTPPGGGVGTTGSSFAATVVPGTPYFVLIFGTAAGTSTDRRILYYKIDASGSPVLEGGYAGRVDGLGGTQFSPGAAAGDTFVAAGHIISDATAGDNNAIAYKYPIALAYFGEGESALVIIPSINQVIAETPILESLSDFWDLKKDSFMATAFGANIFAINDGPFGASNRSRGFFVPALNQSGSLFLQAFYLADIQAHNAGTANPSNAWLAANAQTHPTGLIASLFIGVTPTELTISGAGTNKFWPYADYGPILADQHATFVDHSRAPAFPFPKDNLRLDGSPAASPNHSYYGNASVFPTNPNDPSAPWLLFFPHLYAVTDDRDHAGLAVYEWDPKQRIATFLDYKEGQLFNLGTDVASTTGENGYSAAVTWDRNTGQVTFFVRSSEVGAKSLIVAEFGKFLPLLDFSTVGEKLKIRAWGFQFDGHDFYVLRLGQQGTLVYDATTQQWSEFITAGETVWNAEHGVMWNGYAVVGDNTTGQLYRLDPEATQDEGDKDITRIVTGGIALRGRNVARCNAVRLTASVGAPTAAAPTVSLRFSDDNGNTWEDAGSITLSNGDFDQEIVWRALGLMRAPGRVFEITDVGGMMRIDDADMETDREIQS